MYMNMQPKKWKCRKHKKAFLEPCSLHSEIQEHNSFEVYCNSKDISRYNTSFLGSVGCVRNFAGCNFVLFWNIGGYVKDRMFLYDFVIQGSPTSEAPSVTCWIKYLKKYL